MSKEMRSIAQQSGYYAVITLLVLLGTNKSIFSYLAFGLCGFFILFANNDKGVSLLLFLVSLANIFKAAPGRQSFYTYLLLFFVCCVYLKKGRKVSDLVLSVTFFTMVVLTNTFAQAGFDMNSGIKLGCNLLLIIYCIQDNHIERDYVSHSYAYICGVLASSGIALLDSPVFHISNYVERKTQRVIGGDSILRFSGLYGDPNYYAVNVIIALCLIVILNHGKKMRKLFAVGCSICFVLVGLMTRSKSAVLMFILPAVLYLYSCVKRKKYIAGVGTVLIFVIVASVALTGKFELVNQVLYRFTMTGSDITSGRTELWRDYMAYFGQHPFKFLIGNSIGIYTLNGFAPHNTYIDMIYQLGMVGTVWMIAVLVILRRRMQLSFRPTLLNRSIFACIFIMYFFLSELQYFDAPIHLILAFMVMSVNLDAKAKGGDISELESEVKRVSRTGLYFS